MQPSPWQDLVMQPLNFSFSSPMQYLVRTYDNSSDPFFVTLEPGNLSQSYPLIYGESGTTTSISPNFLGGGLLGFDGNVTPINGGTSYEVSLVIGNQSGGASYIWVTSDRGEILYNESLISSSSLSEQFLSPWGYTGEYSFNFPVVDTNSSVSIYVKSAWGGVTIIKNIRISPSSPPPLYFSAWFLSMLLLIAFVISNGYRIFAHSKKTNQLMSSQKNFRRGIDFSNFFLLSESAVKWSVSKGGCMEMHFLMNRVPQPTIGRLSLPTQLTSIFFP